MSSLFYSWSSVFNSRDFMRSLGLFVLVLAGATVNSDAVFAQSFEFQAAPHQGLNRVYRVETLTGEMAACQYGAKDEGSIGITLCYPAGDGARGQAPGEYGLVASRHQQEGGVFRVNKRSGEMSICYVLNDERVVCTPPAK